MTFTEVRERMRTAGSPFACGSALLLAAAVAQAAGSGAPDSARQRELMHLLKQDCGACHGMRLTGGLGPPLTPSALKDRPADAIAATILHGRPGTPMPPWAPFMSDAEAAWLAARLQEGAADAR